MIPDNMKAVLLPAYQGNIIRAMRSLEIQEIPIPELDDNEVLIEVEAASINPSDLAFIQGGYNIRKALPAIPGFEGTGKVILCGGHDDARRLSGQRVSFFSQSDRGGSWASHIPVKAQDCITINENLPAEQAACLSVNPFTAYAMIELALDHGSNAIIQNASGGQVAKFINALAVLKNLVVINIVRKEEQLKELKNAGCKHVLWSQDENFRKELSDLAKENDARLAFDAVGGEQSGFILEAMPASSSLYLYGALGSRTLSEIPASDVIFRKKSILGFNMNEWKEDLSGDEFDKVSSRIQQLFTEGKLKTEIQGSYALQEHDKALMQYIRAMSAGKVLLIP